MKKIVSLLLILSIVLSLIVVPAISVSAADTTLFKTDTQSSPYTISDYSSLTNDDLADQNITIGGAKIYLSTNSAMSVTPSMTVSDDGKTLTAKYSSEKYVQASDIYLLPENVPEGVKKATVTAKIKPLFQDASGNDKYAKNSEASYIQFCVLGKRENGSSVRQRAMNWYVPTQTTTATGDVDGDGNPIYDTTYKPGYFQRGAGAGATSYSNASVTPVADSDGFYNLMFSSYKDTSGTQYAYIYDMNNNGSVVGYHSYNSSAANYAEQLGYGLAFSLFGTSNTQDTNQAMGISLKDISASYEYGGAGLTTASGMNLSLDGATNTYSFANAIGANSSPYVHFKSASDLTTGYVINDFSLKSTTATYGSGSNYSCSYHIRVGTGESYGFAIDNGRIGSFNTSLYSYNLKEDKISTSAATGPAIKANSDGWYDLRIVATKSEESDSWAYAVYDRNASLTEPLIVKQSKSKTYNGLYFGYYIDSNSRAKSSATPSKPNFERTVYVKDLNIYSTDSYEDYGKAFSSCYYDSSLHTSNGLVIVDDATVRYDTSIYINTTSSARAILVLYDSNGNELAVEKKTLGNGLYEFTAKNPFTVTVEDTSKVTLAKLYVYNGSAWVTDAGEYITDEERYENFLSKLNTADDFATNIDEIKFLLDSSYFTLYNEMRTDAELNSTLYTTATGSTLSEFKESFNSIVFESYLQSNTFNIDVKTDLGGRRGTISVDKKDLPKAYGLIEVYDSSDKLLKKYTVNVKNGTGYYNIYSPNSNPSKVDITLTSDKEGSSPISEKKSVSIEDIYLPPVFITELTHRPVNVYLPDTTVKNGGITDRSFQFVELYNYSDTPVDLSEYTFIYTTTKDHKFDFVFEADGSKILNPGELYILGVYSADSADSGYTYDTEAGLKEYWDAFNKFYAIDVPVTNRVIIPCVKSGDSSVLLDGLERFASSKDAGVHITAEIRKGDEVITKVDLGDDGKNNNGHSVQFIPGKGLNKEENFLFASGNFPYKLMSEQKLDYCEKIFFSNSSSLKVMSYNIDGLNDPYPITERYPFLVETIKAHDADIIGFQEVNCKWAPLLTGEDLSDYAYVDGHSASGHTFETITITSNLLDLMNPIFYKKDMFTLIDSGCAYLTPDGKRATQQWDSIDTIKRVMTWAVLQNKETKETTSVLSAHLTTSGKESRIGQTTLIYKKGEELKKKYGGGIVILGDHNFHESSEPYRTYMESGVVVDSKYLTTNHMSVRSAQSYDKYSEIYGSPIDYCFVSPEDYMVEKCQVIDGEYPDITLSDHSAIYVELIHKDLIYVEENLYEITDTKLVSDNGTLTATATAKKVTAFEDAELKAIAATYNENGCLINIEFFDIDSADYETKLSFPITSDAKSVKWFIWEMDESYSPVAKSIETEL